MAVITKENNTAKMNFAREAEKNEKAVMEVVNGEKNGVAAVVVGKCSREEANTLCDSLSALVNDFPKGRFSCVFDGKGNTRFDLCGDIAFVAKALQELSAQGSFGENL